ncbi:MAG: VOC family protein [Pseudomonadota bacterium]
MADDVQSILSHISIGTNEFDRAVAFYDRVLPSLGCKRIMEHPGAVAWGKLYPEFWVQTPVDGEPASIGNGTHISFLALDQASVDAFHKSAIEAAAQDDGAPGPRPMYGEPYYGCFVRDLDGHKIEAAYWDFELAQKLGMG